MGPSGGCGDGVPQRGEFCFVEVELPAILDPGSWIVADLDGDGGSEVALKHNPDGTGAGSTLVGRWSGDTFDTVALHDEPLGWRPLLRRGSGVQQQIVARCDGGIKRLWLSGDVLEYHDGEDTPNMQFTECMATIDVESDGADEVVALVYEGTPTRPVIRLLTLDAQATWGPMDSPLADYVNSIGTAAAGDLDGDGKAELAITYSLGPTDDGAYDPELHRVFVFRSDGAELVEAWNGPAGLNPENGSRNLVLADLDDDGVQDIVVAGWRRVTVGHGRGDATFEALEELSFEPYGLPWDGIPGSDALAEIAVGDFDGDGAAELVAAVETKGAHDLVVVEDAFGAPSTTVLIPAHDSGSVAVGDLNGDGIDDLLTSRQAGDQRFQLLLLSDP